MSNMFKLSGVKIHHILSNFHVVCVWMLFDSITHFLCPSYLHSYEMTSLSVCLGKKSVDVSSAFVLGGPPVHNKEKIRILPKIFGLSSVCILFSGHWWDVWCACFLEALLVHQTQKLVHQQDQTDHRTYNGGNASLVWNWLLFISFSFSLTQMLVVVAYTQTQFLSSLQLVV